MNLRQGGGRVPVRKDWGDLPWVLVPFPDREKFDELYRTSTPEQRDRTGEMMRERCAGKTLQEVATAHGVTRERVRQIEAKFQRRMRVYLPTLSDA